jgi:hypothetical protein
MDLYEQSIQAEKTTHFVSWRFKVCGPYSFVQLGLEKYCPVCLILWMK